MKTFVVVNPNAAGGRAARAWPALARRLKRAIGPFEAALTEAPGHAVRLAREAVAAGAERVIAVGGDGTASEAADGLLAPGARTAGAALGFVPCGTGGDLRRNADLPRRAAAAIARLASSEARAYDLGLVEARDADGAPMRRVFLNVASLGLTGDTARMVNGAPIFKSAAGRVVFPLAAAWRALRHRANRVRLTLDGEVLERTVLAVAVANGPWFGGGMMIAPGADPSDGLLDVVIVNDRSKLATLRDLPLLYSGAHVRDPSVEVRRCRVLTAEPLDARETLVEVDGETPGLAPARFEALPAALRLLGARA